MADKSFGVKELNILGSGTPSIDSQGDLNLNANKVAISTDVTVGGASTFTGNITANGNIIGDSATNISGINSVTATCFFGCGAGLTGIDAGFSADSDRNLFASNTCSGCNFSGATDNVLLGQCAGRSITSGDGNIAIGCKAMGNGVTTGNYNIAFGKDAGCNLTSGPHNIFIGWNAG